MSNEISRERRQPIQSSLRPAIFDRDVLTLDVTGFVQATAERAHYGSERLSRLSIQKSDHRHRRLLRARHERPRGHTTAEQRDECAPFHSITSLACASRLGGTVTPIALAVGRLMTNSNWVGCMTGRSAGFSPFKMRPV